MFFGAYDIWCDILIDNSDVAPTTYILGRRAGSLRSTSPWWIGVSLLGGASVKFTNWFMDDLSLRVGFGLLTFFWEDTWIGNSSLHLRFPRLFQIYNHTIKYVREVGRWDWESWIYNLMWMRLFLFTYELALFTEFQSLIRDLALFVDRDEWRWRESSDGVYYVPSAYSCPLTREFTLVVMSLL